MLRQLFLLVCLLAPGLLLAGGGGPGGDKPARDDTPKDNRQAYQMMLCRTDEEIKIDGILNELVWQQREAATDFWLNFPRDSAQASAQTEVYVAYNETYLYIAARNHDPNPGKPNIIASRRRDFDNDNTDFFGVLLGTYNDRTNGYLFAVSAIGVQSEALVARSDDSDESWDNRWFSAVSHNEHGWTVEMAIPYKSIKYSNVREWGINFLRRDQKANELSSWAPVAQVFDVESLNFAGSLQWDAPPPKAGLNVALIPYLSGAASVNYLDGGRTFTQSRIGTDAKIAVSPSLTLDLTFNPDFSQANIDRQVVNLSRFEINLPEQRQFFVENSDLFSRFGFSTIQPFNTREVGLSAPMLYGARLSGKLGENWRVGLLNVQTEGFSVVGFEEDSTGLEIPVDTSVTEAQNYTVAAVQRQIGGTSNISAIFVNRQGFTNGGRWNSTDFNRVAGIDANLLTRNNVWRGKAFYHRSFGPENLPEQFAHAAYFGYRGKAFRFFWNHEYVGKNYDAQVGFVPRRRLGRDEEGNNVFSTFYRIEPFTSYTFFTPESKTLVSHSIFASTSLYTDSNRVVNDRFSALTYEMEFRSTAFAFGRIFSEFTRLYFPFSPVGDADALQLPEGGFETVGVSFYGRTDRRKALSFEGFYSRAGFFTGFQNNYVGEANYRWQPIGSFNLRAEYTVLDFREYNNYYNSFWQVRLDGDVTFSKSLFLNAVVQFNTLRDEFQTNLRLQWRFAPMSDIFIVYGEQFDRVEGDDEPGALNDVRQQRPIAVSNRALIFKMVYWLQL